MSFIGIIQKLVGTIPPWWLRSKHTGALLESFGLLQDNAIESLGDGLRLSQPLRCDSSALQHLARDRTIRIYGTEPVDSKRQRLSQWWQLHRGFGSLFGQLDNIAPFFLPARPLMRAVHQDGAGGSATWWTRNPDGSREMHRQSPSNWDFDGETAQWSRYWIIIYRDADMTYPTPGTWDGGSAWNDGTLWDGGPNETQIADIVNGLKDAKSAHSQLHGVIMCNDPAELDPTGTSAVLGDGSTTYPVGNWSAYIDHTTGLPSRPPFLSWLYDLG